MDSAAIDLQHQFYDMLMQSQYWSPERLRDYQRSQLAQLLRHAKKNVPFYENRLDAVLRPNGDIDWDRWGEIPIVRRSDMVEHREAMQARELPPGHFISGTLSTSGSSGVPVTVTIASLMLQGNTAVRWRSERHHNVDWSRRFYARVGNPKALWPDGLLGGAWGPSWDKGAKSGTSLVLDLSARPEQQLEFLRRHLPDYAAIGPHTAYTVAVEAQRTGQDLSLDAIFATGEKLTDEVRTAFRTVFGARAIELYSCKEASHIACRCATSYAWHVNAEMLLLEIIGQDDLPVPDGQSGRVVVTPFFSTAQPLIRYELGDIASLASGCMCGVTLPLIKSLDGRSIEMFSHPDGRLIVRHFPEKYRDVLQCRSWQLAQIGAQSFEIRYVPLTPESKGDEAVVRAAFKEWYFDDADVSFVRLPEIPESRNGKRIEYVNDYRRTSPRS